MFGMSRRRRFLTKRTAQIGAGVLLISSMSMAATGVAMAAAKNPDKVSICHRDNNDKQPYGPGPISVSINAADGSLGNGNNDHTGHTGPVGTPGMKAAHDKWGDIIPPYTFGNPQQTFPGLNWDAA